MEQSGPNGQNRTNEDRIEPMWIEWTELDRSRENKGQCELNGPN